MCVSFVSFFFKQKTAYEVRISDWSSDVCSSDLEGRGPCLATCRRTDLKDRRMEIGPIRNDDDHRAAVDEIRALWNAEAGSADEDRLDRSEEHTSELQSLMRISYAVFCLKKKNTKNRKMTIRIQTTKSCTYKHISIT